MNDSADFHLKGHRTNMDPTERVRISDKPVKLIEMSGGGRVKVIAEGITYDEATLCLQVIHNAGLSIRTYDIQDEETGRLLSWTVK